MEISKPITNLHWDITTNVTTQEIVNDSDDFEISEDQHTSNEEPMYLSLNISNVYMPDKFLTRDKAIRAFWGYIHFQIYMKG